MPPDETFSFISRLGFHAVDVAARSLFPQNKVLENPEKEADFLHELSGKYKLSLDELFLGGIEIDGTTLDQAADSETYYLERFRRFDVICKSAKRAGFRSIMGSAGREIPEAGYEKSFERAAMIHTMMINIAGHYGINYHIEPSRNSLLNTPEKALAMIEAVPEL